MKTLIVSYSLTGNNAMLARHLGGALGADVEELVVERGMGNFALALDAMFTRAPAIAAPGHDPADYDLIVCAGPIWMGKIASPIRSYVKHHASSLKRVAFICICGGALGTNPKVPAQLERLTTSRPIAVTQLYINDLLSPEQHGDAKATSAYRISESDLMDGWASKIEEFRRAVEEEVR